MRSLIREMGGGGPERETECQRELFLVYFLNFLLYFFENEDVGHGAGTQSDEVNWHCCVCVFSFQYHISDMIIHVGGCNLARWRVTVAVFILN